MLLSDSPRYFNSQQQVNSPVEGLGRISLRQLKDRKGKQSQYETGRRNTVLFYAISWRIPLVRDIPIIIFGAEVTHPELEKILNHPLLLSLHHKIGYAGLVCAQAHRQELIQDLYKTWHDPQRGTVTGGMIRSS